MPRLWSATIDTHRREVRDAIVDTTIALVEQRGLLSVTMSLIAEETGIGRGTLYKYFPDVESILKTWHERQIAQHLQELRDASESLTEPIDRLSAVLQAYALIAHGSRGHVDTELAALLHSHHESHTHAEQELHWLLHGLLRDSAKTGDVRRDIAPGELATYCLRALTAANVLTSKAAVRRLVEMILSSLRPQ